MAVQTPALRRETENENDQRVEQRIRPQGFGTADALDLLGSAFGSFCLTYLLYERLTPLSGGLGFFVTWYGFFIAMSWFLARSRLGVLEARDQLARVVVG
ncbi:MAG: phosphate transport system permease protein, partial [Actinomycetota bacterium]|nr:phosphate transport system permease protein [Actinomycetota bacterium]